VFILPSPFTVSKKNASASEGQTNNDSIQQRQKSSKKDSIEENVAVSNNNRHRILEIKKNIK